MSLQSITRPQLEQLECLHSEIPPLPHDYPYQWFTSDPKSKQHKVKATNFKKIDKNYNFELLHAALHVTHLLKLRDEMYKYKMDPTRTVGTTEWTRDAWLKDGGTGRRTDGRMDGRMDGVKPIYPQQPRLNRSYTMFMTWDNMPNLSQICIQIL